MNNFLWKLVLIANWIHSNTNDGIFGCRFMQQILKMNIYIYILNKDASVFVWCLCNICKSETRDSSFYLQFTTFCLYMNASIVPVCVHEAYKPRYIRVMKTICLHGRARAHTHMHENLLFLHIWFVLLFVLCTEFDIVLAQAT